MTYSIIKKSELEGALRLDAEYYQPEYLDIAKKLEKFGFQTLRDLSSIDITKGETPLWRGDDYLEQGIPFLRSENLVSAGIDLSNIVFISEKVHERMKRSKIYPNDILVAIVGATIGQTGLVANNFSEYNSNQANAIIRPRSKEMSAYLAIILETSICQLQIERLKGGGARDNLDLHEVKVIKIPKPNESILSYCFSAVDEVGKLRKQGELFYSQAEEMLLKELGLEGFEEEEDLFSIVKFSDIEKVRRIDAEYFQPKYEMLISRIKQAKHSSLGDLVLIKKGIEIGAEQYQEQGKLFFRVSSLSKQGIIDKDQKYLSDELYQKLKANFEPKVGEILLTKDATPGIAYVLKEKVEGIISSGILRLKLKQEIEAEYLALFINSVLGQMQAERDAGGSIISHWKPEQVKNLVVPILPQEIQQKIAELVIKSHQARQEAQELLKEAKQKVESLIDEK